MNKLDESIVLMLALCGVSLDRLTIFIDSAYDHREGFLQKISSLRKKYNVDVLDSIKKEAFSHRKERQVLTVDKNSPHEKITAACKKNQLKYIDVVARICEMLKEKYPNDFPRYNKQGFSKWLKALLRNVPEREVLHVVAVMCGRKDDVALKDGWISKLTPDAE